MRKGRIYLVLLLAVAGMVGLIVAGALRGREPRYGGKSLSEWVKQYDPSAPLAPKDQANEAIRHIGTNAFPYLLSWITYEVPSRKLAFNRTITPALRFFNRDWKPRYDQLYLAEAAPMAFAAIGPGAVAAVPELTRLLNGTNSIGVRLQAGQALALLQGDGLAPLLMVLTNKQINVAIRYHVASDIALLGTDNRPGVRALQEFLADPDTNVSYWAGVKLRAIDRLRAESTGKKAE